MAKPPKTRRGSSTSDFDQGTSVPDPYRHFEQGIPKGWMAIQNIYSNVFFRGSTAPSFRGNLEQLLSAPTYGPVKITSSGRVFYTRIGDRPKDVLYTRETVDSPEEVVVDPNTLEEDITLEQTVEPEIFFPSPDGKKVAYSLTKGSNVLAQCIVHDLETGHTEEFAEIIQPHLVWLPDSSGFLYGRTREVDAKSGKYGFLRQTIHRHHLGEPIEEDVSLFDFNAVSDGTSFDKVFVETKGITPDGRFAVVRTYLDKQRGLLSLVDTTTGEFKHLTEDESGNPVVGDYEPKLIGNRLYVRTDTHPKNSETAPNGLLCAVDIKDLESPPTIDTWQVIIPEQENTLEDFSIVLSEQGVPRVFTHHMHDVQSVITEYGAHGETVQRLPLPIHTTTSVPSGKHPSRLLVTQVSDTMRRRVLMFNADSSEMKPFLENESTIDPNEYETLQFWVRSNDGVEVPARISYKRGEKLGKLPTLLRIYGGFGKPLLPGFNSLFVPWMMASGAYAVGNIRGGGEFGTQWYRQGVGEFRQNSIDDVIAIAEGMTGQRPIRFTDQDNYSIQQITTPRNLGLYGASNGGYMTLLTRIQRPDLFGAVTAVKPITDIIRSHLIGYGSQWTEEFADPRKDVKRALKVSALHQITGKEHPPTLVAIDRDDKVAVPVHGAKFGAEDQFQSPEGSQTVIVITSGGGHGVGKDIQQRAELWNKVLRFNHHHLSTE